MRTTLAIFVVLLAGAVLAQAPEGCENRIFHLIDRAQNSQQNNPNLDDYQQIFGYFEDRLLHNKTYTVCYNYTNEFCQLATTKLLPSFFKYVKGNAQNVSQAATDYYYVRATTIYFLQRCGRGVAPKADLIDREEFNRATCKNSALRIYAFLTSKDRIDAGRLNEDEYKLLFETFRSMFKRAHERVCLNPSASTPRILFRRISEDFTAHKPDRHLLSEVWKFVSYLGVEYLRDAGLNQNVTRICDVELKQMLDYLASDNGFTDYNAFVFHFTAIQNQTQCFRRNTECKVYANKLYETSLNVTLVPKTSDAFLAWWDVIKFNVRHYIYNCYFTSNNDTNSSIWRNTYTFTNQTCTVRVNDTIQTLRSTEIEAIGNTNVTGPLIYYVNREIQDVGNSCLDKSANCSTWQRAVNYFFNQTLGIKRGQAWDDWGIRDSFYSNYYVAKLNALKYINSCAPRSQGGSTPTPGTGVRCSSYLEALRDVIARALANSNFYEAVSLMRQNKILLEQYRDCNNEKGKTKLCLDLSEQLRETYIKALFTGDVEGFKQKLNLLQSELQDITEECTRKKL